MRLVKTNSSKWIHETFSDQPFAWQSGYGAFAVSYSQLNQLERYLARQAAHHKSLSFQDEFRALLRRHNIEWDERFIWQ